MPKRKKKSKKEKGITTPPQTGYPKTPHIVGMDWLELAVASPARTAELYRAIGLTPRMTVGRGPRFAVGGLVIQLKPTPRATKPATIKKTKKTKKITKAAKPAPSGIRIQLAVDHVETKREQLRELGLTPTPLRRLKRGDRAFDWLDPDGHMVRFVGPAREEKK